MLNSFYKVDSCRAIICAIVAMISGCGAGVELGAEQTGVAGFALPQCDENGCPSDPNPCTTDPEACVTPKGQVCGRVTNHMTSVKEFDAEYTPASGGTVVRVLTRHPVQPGQSFDFCFVTANYTTTWSVSATAWDPPSAGGYLWGSASSSTTIDAAVKRATFVLYGWSNMGVSWGSSN